MLDTLSIASEGRRPEKTIDSPVQLFMRLQ